MDQVSTEVKVIRVPHERMVYEVLGSTAREWDGYVREGYRLFVLDLSKVGFMDSASIGCLMDFYRKTREAGGRIHLAGVQPRVDTLLSIVKAKSLFGIHATVDEARAAFGAQ